MNKKHPAALYILFLTEMWERFGYYLMIGLYALYLNEYWHKSEGDASDIYGTYIGLTYLSPLLGGYLADKIIGHKWSIYVGASLMALGYFLIGIANWQIFILSSGLVILGNGLFKPNISTLVGNLYPQGDPRRDSAFNIFYLGVNIGALFSPFAAVYMRHHYGWNSAFQLAGWGMIIGLCTFILFNRTMVGTVDGITRMGEEIVSEALQKRRNLAFFMMCFVVMFFWMAFHQNGSTMLFYVRDNVDRTLGGFLAEPLDEIYSEAINSFFVVTLTGVVVWFFMFLRKRDLEPKTPVKIGIGMLLTGASYLIMASGGNGTKVSFMVPTLSYLVITLGELCLSPMGLSMASQLAPRGKVAIMMGVWFLATAAGNKLAGKMGLLWSIIPHSQFFLILAVTSFLAALVLFLNKGWLNKAMPEVKNTAADNLLPPDLVAAWKQHSHLPVDLSLAFDIIMGGDADSVKRWKILQILAESRK